LVMELLEGKSLQHEIRDWVLSPKAILQIIAPVCDALHAAHEISIVHRDIKPANIFLHGDVPKVLDFGLAKLVGSIVIEQRITLDGWMVGTPLYMAPERFGSETYDGKSDVYSVGIMLHQLLTGKMPFAEDTDDPLVVAMMHTNQQPVRLGEHIEGQPIELEALILRCLAKDPASRPDADLLAKSLSAIAEGLPGKAKTPRQHQGSPFHSLPTVASEVEAQDVEGPPADIAPATRDLASTMVAKKGEDN
jgi:serine/threonine protein kinase